MRIRVVTLALAVGCAFFSPPARAEDPPGPKEIGQAIERGKAYLLAAQQADGSWPIYAATNYRSHGPTALALLALLVADVPPGHRAIARGLAQLKAQKLDKTYDVGLTCMALHALCRAATPKKKAAQGSASRVHRCRLAGPYRLWLATLAGQLAKAQRKGWWGYYALPPQDEYDVQSYDNSNTQYAVLGLRAAALCGVRLDPAVWRGLLDHFLAAQQPARADGGEASRSGPLPRGFAYRLWDGGATMTMGCVGTACLLIAREQLAVARRLPPGLGARAAEAIGDGMAWIHKNYLPAEGGDAKGSDGYLLYGQERAGVLAGVPRFGGKDWYLEGARVLLSHQQRDGAFKGRYGERIETAFALLFLKQATLPLRVISGR